MNTQNTLVAWRRYVLSTAAVVAISGAGYLAFHGDGDPQAVPVQQAVHANSGDLPDGAAPQSGTAPDAGDRTAKGAPAGLKTDPPRVVFKPVGPPGGAPMLAAGVNPDADKGRVLKLDPVALRKWSSVAEGQTLALPSPTGEPLEGLVHLVQQEGGWVRIGGALPNEGGSFSLNTDFNEVSGLILRPESGVGYKIQMDGNAVVLVERRLSTLLCYPGQNPAAVMASSDGVARRPAAAAVSVPVINTRPGAKGVIFVDFDGETVTDPAWNSGRTINAAPTPLTSDQITQVLALSAQDYAPFDVTLTTDSALYAATPAGLRMHVVVTPTDTAAPGAGGVAYVDSWSNAGRGFRSDVVCWVFNQSVRGVAEALSHEVGHTLGLSHDGQTNGTEYYAGHGGGLTTPTSWAPIMGVGYYKSLVQWSKGEYTLANNTEDDLAIIGKPANRFGLIQNDLPNGVKSLALAGGAFQNSGLLRNADSVDVYKFSTAGGQLTATVQPDGADTDLDVKLELADQSGATLQLSDIPDSLGAAVNKTLAAGSYQLTVRSTGTGAKPAGGYTTGYSAYGSVGRYILNGSLGGGISLPVFTSPGSISAAAGVALNYTVGVSGAATVSVASSVLPPGLVFDARTLVLSGVPTQASGSGAPGSSDGPGLLKLVATNSSGSVSAEFVITVAKGGLPLADAFPAGALSTSPAAPWTGVNMQRADGTTATVAQSGLIANSSTTTLAFEYTPAAVAGQTTPTSLLTFYWKASSEPLGNRGRSGDFVQCRVNGKAANDADSGKQLVLSGETGWIKQTVRLKGAGVQRVEFVYTKDASLSAGQDRVWVYATSVGQPPVIARQPASVKLQPGTTSFTLTAEVQGADSLVWKKDFATLADGTSSTGSVLAGASAAVLNVTNAGGADMGYYWLEARNAFGVVITNPVRVVLSAPPVFTQQPAAPVGLKVGDPLLLSANVSGATPLFYRWSKDGVAMGWRQSEDGAITLNVAKTTAATAGRYKVSVTNQFGTVTSDEIVVGFTQAAQRPAR